MNDVFIATSTISDGSMSVGVSAEEQLKNRSAFLESNGATAAQAILVSLDYRSGDFRRYFTVSGEQAGDGVTFGSSITSDALFTRSKNLALLLPVADCVGVVLYDPANQVLGMAHLGRHNLVQSGGSGIVEFMASEFGTNPATLWIWLGPAAGREQYPLHDFDNRSLHEVSQEQLAAAGVNIGNITVDSRDTTTDGSLFSHSEFLRGNRTTDGRQAIVAMMRS